MQTVKLFDCSIKSFGEKITNDVTNIFDGCHVLKGPLKCQNAKTSEPYVVIKKFVNYLDNHFDIKTTCTF